MLAVAVGGAYAQGNCCALRVRLEDRTGAAVSGARVEVRRGEVALEAATGGTGEVSFTIPTAGVWTVMVSSEDFLPVEREVRIGRGERIELEVTLAPAGERHESVTVEAEAPGAGQGATTAVTVTRSRLDALPARPANIRDALPLLPGVTRTPEGKLRISDRPEPSSLLLVNSVDVTDPATGDFGATVPIDAVATIDLYKSPFLAEYGRFTAAVVAVNTRGGESQWRYELNDPTPEFRIFDARLRGIRAFTPRFSVRGPMVKDRVYVAQSLEYGLRKRPVRALPFPFNETKSQGWNSLTQFDFVASPEHFITLAVHAAPERIQYANLDFYNPQPTTPNLAGHEVRVSLTDRLTLAGGTLTSLMAFGQNRGKVWGQGAGEFTLGVTENSGYYFSRQDRKAQRFQWLESYSFAPRGKHTLQIGGRLLYTRLRNGWENQAVNVQDLGGRLLRRIEYGHGPGFRLADTEMSLYFQDHWDARSGLSLETGIRMDYQEETGVARFAPRLGLAWSPLGDEATTLRAGLGWFYDRVPLNVFGWPYYPAQTVTEFDAAGDVLDGPRLFANVLGGASLPPLSAGGRRSGSFAPRSLTWQVQAERRFGERVRVRASYLESRSEGLMAVRPRVFEEGGALVMEGRGRSWHRSFETVSRFRLYKESEVLASYVYSWTQGNLNDFTVWLGNYPAPIVRDDVEAMLPGTIPHRFLAWGVFPLSEKWRFSPTVEWRNGFPYAAFDERQEYAGEPYSRRFPSFFSLDFRISRDILFKKHMFRVSFSMFNVTNHWNPTAVRWNVADPQFGEFLATNKRRFRLNFDILF